MGNLGSIVDEHDRVLAEIEHGEVAGSEEKRVYIKPIVSSRHPVNKTIGRIRDQLKERGLESNPLNINMLFREMNTKFRTIGVYHS